ncbi:uncharacterized protein PHA67_011833 [Liasis olivaceus]
MYVLRNQVQGKQNGACNFGPDESITSKSSGSHQESPCQERMYSCCFNHFKIICTIIWRTNSTFLNPFSDFFMANKNEGGARHYLSLSGFVMPGADKLHLSWHSVWFPFCAMHQDAKEKHVFQFPFIMRGRPPLPVFLGTDLLEPTGLPARKMPVLHTRVAPIWDGHQAQVFPQCSWFLGAILHLSQLTGGPKERS